MHFLYFLLDLFHFDQRTREYLDRAWSNDSVIFLLLCGKRSTNSSSLSPLIRSYSVRFVYEGKRIGDEDTAESVSVKFKKAREKWRHIWNKRKGIGPLIRPKSDLLSCSTKSLANSHVTIHEVDYDSPKSSKGREREELDLSTFYLTQSLLISSYSPRSTHFHLHLSFILLLSSTARHGRWVIFLNFQSIFQPLVLLLVRYWSHPLLTFSSFKCPPSDQDEIDAMIEQLGGSISI